MKTALGTSALFTASMLLVWVLRSSAGDATPTPASGLDRDHSRSGAAWGKPGRDTEPGAGSRSLLDEPAPGEVRAPPGADLFADERYAISDDELALELQMFGPRADVSPVPSRSELIAELDALVERGAMAPAAAAQLFEVTMQGFEAEEEAAGEDLEGELGSEDAELEDTGRSDELEDDITPEHNVKPYGGTP